MDKSMAVYMNMHLRMITSKKRTQN